ncbi:regulatory protein RecX [uncultured Microbulbifer sp.]|uniref:regulatory protein RecX n=1 Tax=uncultured Microbulbifer sp. TaxID=348147 RepID=UPI00263956E7|nr:regulatory protein RecX [uncultured Microbulbifer sp.]
MSFPDDKSGSQPPWLPDSLSQAAQSLGTSSAIEPPRESADAFQALFTHALDLLSRREHSCHELRQKLGKKHPLGDFDAVLLRLQELNYQSDQRFAEVFCRSRVQRGQGPLRIRQELQLRGIPSPLLQATMDQLQEEVDWFELALEQLQRKFRRPIDPALDRLKQAKERARRQRYLAYRGFFGDAIQYAIAELDAADNCESGADTGF